jgi:hypothetical protein
MGYRISFIGASVLNKTSGYLDHLVMEAIEIHLKKNFNRESGFILSQAWSPTTSMLLNEKQDQTE